MLSDAITIGLGLPNLKILGASEASDSIEVVARFSEDEATCPRCQRPTPYVHQWSLQAKRDLKILGKKLCLHLWKRRFRCKLCRYVFTEDDPVCGRRRRTTRRLRHELTSLAQEATVKAVSRWQDVSEGLVQRSWLEETVPAAPLSSHKLVGLDGFCVRRPGVMWSGIWDLQTRRPVAVASGQRQRDVEKLLQQHLDPHAVQAVVTDFWRPNRSAVQAILPQAAIVADKFHVVALVNRALHEVRGRGRLRPQTQAWVLQRNLEHLRAGEQAQLSTILEQDAILRRAWLLKEGLRFVYQSRDADQARRRLGHWLCDAQDSGLKPFQRAARTIQNWREEILNYWQYPLTNAMVEGKHNRVKVLKRRAYGYRNDRMFSLRILNLIHT